jgi:SulP family sulfate permease
MEDVTLLKRMPLFKQLDHLELVQVSKLTRHRRFKAGEKPIEENSPGTALFIVKSGRFKAYAGSGANPTPLATFAEGDSFGELALIDHGPRSATVEAEEESILLEFDEAAFRTLLDYSEALRSKLLESLVESLAQKLRRTNDRLAQLL